MHFTTFVFKNLTRRKARSLLTIIGLAVAIGAVVALVGVANGFKDSFMEVYTSRGVDVVITRAGGDEEMAGGLPTDLGPKIAALPGVENVVGGLVDMVSFPNDNVMGALVNGWPVDCTLWGRLTFEPNGRRLQKGDQGKVIIGKILARNLGKKVGDTIDPYQTQPFEIVGIYDSPIIFEKGGMVILLEDLQREMNRPGEVTGFTVVAKKEPPMTEAQMDGLIKQIEGLAPDLQVKRALDFVSNVSQIKIASAVAWVTAAIAVFIGAIGMLNTMIMSVFERTKEIGTLRAIGWKKSRIIRMVIGESVVLSIVGAFVGSAFGITLVKLLSKLPNAAGVVRGNVSPDVIVQGFVVAIIVGLAGAIYPALWSANLLPTEALRGK